jgi:hypothetical protein
LYETELHLSNYSNHFLAGPAEATLQAKFMGSGQTQASATFRPERKGPDFDFKVEIIDMPLPAMNDLLLAYGDFDVVDGLFSFFSELRIEGGYINGYLRPMFRDVEVYDRREEKDMGLLKKLYEKAVGVIFKILENLPREEVATHVEISGPLDDPEASTWEIIVGLIRNAFFQAILPGFEGEVKRER